MRPFRVFEITLAEHQHVLELQDAGFLRDAGFQVDTDVPALEAPTLLDVLAVPANFGCGGARALAFSPDGAVLAVGTARGAVELRAAGGSWRAPRARADGERRASLRLPGGGALGVVPSTRGCCRGAE